MWKFIVYEWKHWLRSPMIWIFLLINTLLIFGAVSSDNITIGGGVGSVHKNSPHVVQTYYGVMSLICLLMTTAFMNATANRDFQYDMYQFVFTSPIQKRDYYFGKFIGSISIAIIPLLGVSLGSLFGPLMPWTEAERYGDVIWSGHINGLLSFGIPNTVIARAWLYALAIIFRSNIVSFVGAMLIIVFYVVSQGFAEDIEKEWLANLLDPFGFRPHSIIGKYMTVDEKNIQAISLQGAFLTNRLIWLGISFFILFGCYFAFSFSIRKEKVKIQKQGLEKRPGIPLGKIFVPGSAHGLGIKMFLQFVKHETLAIVKNRTFIIIILIGLINLIASLTSFTETYGTDQYPVTYDVVDAIRGSFYIFMLGIITFYSGVLVWKERDARINEIIDATPVRTGVLFISKLFAMIISLAVVLTATIFIGLLAQTFLGYTRYELGVYFKSLLVLDLLSFSFLVIIALLFHYLINNRYIAYFAFVIFVILNSFIWGVFEIETKMLDFGNTPRVIYSDMNGFGPYVSGALWFNVYWVLFCVLLLFLIRAFYIRGKETLFSNRLSLAGIQLKRTRIGWISALLVFILCSSFVYYNTQVLNQYDTSKDQETKRVDYEKTYKKYEGIHQPRYTSLNYGIDIMPYERNLNATITAWAANKSDESISHFHFTLPPDIDSCLISIKGARIEKRDNRLGYWIFKADKPLLPGDSIEVKVGLVKQSKGFENEVSFTQLTHNGTFFNNIDLMPRFGYINDYEVSDKNKRAKLKLPKRNRKPRLDENNLKARRNSYFITDADLVNVNTVISTSPDQIAIAPGSLIKSWEKGGRKYFNYRLDKNSANFYSFISARYEVARQTWNEIDLEVYYIKEHAYNVPNMMKSLEKSLEYYIKNFGPYYHKQCRIIEFPRYASFAQAFPGTMPYSESVGFIADLRDVTKDDIDQVYYIVAHEMGHQWWAHQLLGADMQGSEMMSEGFAQYSALMVMEKEYGKDKMKKFLKYEMDGYLSGRSNEFEAERPLMKSESQPYIHYDKASVVFYYLKEMIGEEKVNAALRSLIDTFAYKASPYPTSLSAVRAFKKVTPDSLHYLIEDLFETITLFSNRVIESTYKRVGNEFEVTLKTTSEKFRADSLGKETAIPVADYIDIGAFKEPEEKGNTGAPIVIKRVKITSKENVFTFRTTEQPYQVGIDPYNYLIDRIPEDNLKKVSEQN